MRKSINHPMLALLAGAGTLVALLAASPVQAATTHHSTEWQVQHYLTCLDLMVSNPARHARLCGPGHLSVMVSDSRGWGYQATPPPVITSTDDCVPPPCWGDKVEKKSLKSVDKKSGKSGKSFKKKGFGKK